jgi:protein tyrosine phosphatase (PTP) superfamily phosphohydrolase (DUF442 family)
LTDPGPTIYPVAVPPPGRLAIMPQPRGDDALDGEMSRLRRSGVDVLVSLQSAAERLDQGLAGEPAAARRAGLEFFEFAVADFGVPDHAEIQPLLDALAARLRAGRYVVVHCRGGVGRSSVVAAGLLVRLGIPAERVWDLIATGRGCRVPETVAQREWPAGLLPRET